MKLHNKMKTTSAAIIAASLFFSAAPFSNANAGEINNTDKVAKSSTAFGLTTNYIGQKESNVIIRIATSQEAGQRSYLRIYDSLGDLLFEDMIFAKTSVKVISVSPEELKSVKIVYSSGSAETKKVLAINAVNVTKYSISETAKLK